MDTTSNKPLAVVTGASSGIGFQGRASRVLPDSVKAGVHRKMAEPGSGRD